MYDGNNSATISGRSLAGAIGGDLVSLTGGTATFADKNVGTGKTVTGTGFSLSGADAPNYTLASTTLTTTASITPLGITVSFTANDKVYDGGTAAAIATRTLNGVLAGDTVTVSRRDGDVRGQERGHGQDGDGDRLLPRAAPRRPTTSWPQRA